MAGAQMGTVCDMVRKMSTRVRSLGLLQLCATGLVI
jgi:hypothetical protein